MPNSADALRRWLGLFFLAVAFALLVWGQLVLSERLRQRPTAFLLYWGVCFLFTLAAITTALLDMRATRRRAREEQDRLLRDTLDDIERESRNRPEE